MTAIMIDGKRVAAEMQARLAERVAQLQAARGITPHLVVIVVGEDAASHVYVRGKERAAIAAGFRSHVVYVPQTIPQVDLEQLIHQYNADSEVHGILIQLPLPTHLDEQHVLRTIAAEKDVDGFHPYNIGRFFLGEPATLPCTPYGVMALLDAYQVPLRGCHAVIVGRSNIVGKPMAQMLLQRDATVTIAHSKTERLSELIRQADLLVVAVGQPHFVPGSWIKPGAVVVDVGVNRHPDGHLVGDVATDEAAAVASMVTPVPGGVGPMTITMLLEQTFQNAARQ